MNQSEVSLGKGKTTALKVSYSPADTTDDKTVTWRSDNEQVAAVDGNGRITAVAKGKAVITAQVGSFTADCQVTVTEDDPVDPPDITDEDIAAAKEVVRLAAILNTNASPSLDEVKVVENAYNKDVYKRQQHPVISQFLWNWPRGASPQKLFLCREL